MTIRVAVEVEPALLTPKVCVGVGNSGTSSPQTSKIPQKTRLTAPCRNPAQQTRQTPKLSFEALTD